MKSKFFVVLMMLFLMAGISETRAQNFNDALEYMQYLQNEQEKINKDMWDYISTVAHSKSARKADVKRKELITTTNDAIKRISKIGGWDNDVAFRDSTLAFLRLCDIVLREDFSKIMDMEAIAEQSYDAMEAYMLARQQANDKIDNAGERLEIEQTIFASDHNITLIKGQDKLSIKLERAGEVFNYYNRMYLIFFKPYKDESFFLEASQKGDIAKMEQLRNSLISNSVKALAVLDTCKSFKGDGSLVSAAKNIIGFYKKEAEESFPGIIDFYLKKDNFEKLKKAIDAKQPQERTKEEVDNYNKAVADYNTAVNVFNTTNTQLNDQRNTSLDRWNTAMQNFLNSHVPAKK
jgi:hypothetical protein